MQCQKCKHENREGAKFCEGCGAKLQAVCPKCGHELRPEARFCDECGARVAQAVSEQKTPVIPKIEDVYTRLQREMPGSLARKIQAAQNLEGENRILSILFADISGSVSVMREMPPENAADLISRCLNVMVDVILKYEGSINRFLGDSVLAFFGVPEAHESDPERAILAALEMRDAVVGLNLNISIGINTGMVYVGPIGPDSHSEFTAMGAAVNLASRLEGAAQPGQVMVGERTYRFTRRAFEFEPVPNLALKGVPEPVTAYIALKPLPKLEKVRGIEGLRVKLIGRDEELDKLKDAFNDTLNGRGQMVSIIGEAGVGKSRLIAELKQFAINAGTPLWLEGRCLSLGITVSYWPFIDMFREYFKYKAEDSDSSRAALIVARLLELVENGHLTEDRFQEIGPLLGYLLSVEFGNDWDHRLKGVDPKQLRNQIFIAVRDLFLALCRSQPLVLVFDDLHWSDSLSLDLISVLIETLTLAPILLLCIYRPEQEHKSWHLANIAYQKNPERYTELRLQELTPEQSQRLLQSLLRIENLSPSLKEMILKKSQGNPFFIEEVVRSLISSEVIYQEGNTWHIYNDVNSIAVPESIQSVIFSRIDRLEQELKHVLQSASVIGRLFYRQLLDQVTEQTRELEHNLWELEDQNLVYQVRVIPEEEFSFKHAFTQETVYQNILTRRRVELHEKVAESIETLYHGGLEEYYEQLAYHYERSSKKEKAVEYLLKAGEKAQQAYLNEAAIGYFKKALEILNELDLADSRKDWKCEMVTRLYEDMGDILRLTGQYGEAREAYQNALAHIPNHNRIWQARLHRKNGINYSSERRYEEALQESITAETTLEEILAEGSPQWYQEWLEVLLYRMLTIHYWLLQWQEISKLAEKLRPVVEQYGSPAQRARFFKGLSSMLLRHDAYAPSEERLVYAQAALKASQESGNPLEIASSQFLVGFEQVFLRNMDEAEEYIRASLKTAERTEDLSLQSRCLTYLTIISRWRGQLEETQNYALRSLALATKLNMPEYMGMARGNLAWVKWREIKLDEAETEGKAGLEILRQLKVPYPFEWTVLWPLMGVKSARGEYSQAIEYIKDMLRPHQQIPPDAIKVLMEKALKAWEVNQTEQVHTYLAQAIKIAQEMGYL